MRVLAFKEPDRFVYCIYLIVDNKVLGKVDMSVPKGSDLTKEYLFDKFNISKLESIEIYHG